MLPPELLCITMTFCNSAAAFKLHCGLKRDSIELRISTRLTPILVIDTIIVYVTTARVEEKAIPYPLLYRLPWKATCSSRPLFTFNNFQPMNALLRLPVIQDEPPLVTLICRVLRFNNRYDGALGVVDHLYLRRHISSLQMRPKQHVRMTKTNTHLCAHSLDHHPSEGLLTGMYRCLCDSFFWVRQRTAPR